MFWPRGELLAYSLINLLNFLIIFLSFFHNALDVAWITTSFNCKSLPMCVTHPINPMGIHLLRCAHGNKRTSTHDAIHDTFDAIV
jgi:hypothetical protein